MSAYNETVAPNDGILLDVIETQNAAATISSVTRRGYAQGFSALATGILSASSGTAAVIARRNGMLVREWTSVLNTFGGVQTAAFPWPIGVDWATRPASLRYPTRWYFEALMVRVGATLSAPFSFGIQCTTAPVAGNGVLLNVPMFVVCSFSGTNAGRWSVANNPRSGGPIVVTDTGILPAVPIAVRIVYEDAPTPRMWAEVNGTVFGLATGIANVPVCADASPANERPFLTAGQGALAGAAGQVDRLANVRVWARELASMT
jgi:hypothetical protein